MAVVILGSLDSILRRMDSKLGHIVGKVATIETTIASGRVDPPNEMSMTVVLGERSEGTNGMSSQMASTNLRVFKFGSKGSSMLLIAQSCTTENIFGGRSSTFAYSLRVRILLAYFRKWVHSGFVGSLLNDFQIERLREGKMHVFNTLTVHPSFQTYPGKHLSNGRSFSWVSHNVSNAGSSKFLRQHASATAVALALDSTSSQAINLRISSTLRQACIGG